jgi:hypothetical protein
MYEVHTAAFVSPPGGALALKHPFWHMAVFTNSTDTGLLNGYFKNLRYGLAKNVLVRRSTVKFRNVLEQ